MSYDFITEFKEYWNQKVKKIRICCLILSLMMISIGLFCFFFPMEMFDMMKIFVSIAFVVFGIYSMISYFFASTYFREPVVIVLGIIHVLFGYILYKTPVYITVKSLTFMLAVLLMVDGVEKISFARRLDFFGLMPIKYLTSSGVLCMIVSVVFMILPMSSAFIVNYIVGMYLLVDGFSLLVQAISMKEVKW